MTPDREQKSGLLSISEIRVPRPEVDAAHGHLSEVGREGNEGVALWAGVTEGHVFHVRATIIPVQKAHQTTTGLCYTVDTAELHRINVWLFENRMTLIAQLHSHPGAAYHSELDDDLPITTTVGCISLVVPDFARLPFIVRRCAVYRLMRGSGWVSLTPDEAVNLIHIVESDDVEPDVESPDGGSNGERRDGTWGWLTSLIRRH